MHDASAGAAESVVHDASAGAVESGAHGDVSAAGAAESPPPDEELPRLGAESLPPAAGAAESPPPDGELPPPAGEEEPPPPGGEAAEAEHGNIRLRSRRKRQELQPVQALSEGMF